MPEAPASVDDRLTYGAMVDRLTLEPGLRATRLSWAGRHYLVRIPGSSFTIDAERPLGQALPWMAGRPVRYLPHFDLFDHVTHTVAVWTATPQDMEAEDWVVESSAAQPASPPQDL